jgi:hypothetical protein
MRTQSLTHRTPCAATKLWAMAEAVSRENLSARLADVRESLSLLADYL